MLAHWTFDPLLEKAKGGDVSPVDRCVPGCFYEFVTALGCDGHAV
jgi:hypothetical protein